MRVDFHMHSTFSDGVETPTQLLAHAKEAGLSMIALTDHDEIEGLHEMMSISDELTVITGCEFSGSYKGKDIHILGYLFDKDNTELCSFLSFFKEKRKTRIKEIVKRCNHHGYNISFTTLEKRFPYTRSYGRPHVAQLLIDAGYAKDINEVFSTILSSKSPCYVPKVKIDVPQIINIIHNAHGLAVLAHPKLIQNDQYVEELLLQDFDGIEVYHSKHTKEDEHRYLIMADNHNLFVTGGSDYHGNGYRFPHRLGEYIVDSHKVEHFINIVNHNLG